MSNVLTFVISDIETGRVLGLALVCPIAQYASVMWLGRAERLDRRFIELGDWRIVKRGLRMGVPPGPLESDHVAVRLLLDHPRRRSVYVQYVAEWTIDVPRLNAAQLLDTELRHQADGVAWTDEAARPTSST